MTEGGAFLCGSQLGKKTGLIGPILAGMGILELVRRRFFPSNDERGPVECHYGHSPLATERCGLIVPPGEGVMYGDMVFCSEAHSALDQDDNPF